MSTLTSYQPHHHSKDDSGNFLFIATARTELRKHYARIGMEMQPQDVGYPKQLAYSCVKVDSLEAVFDTIKMLQDQPNSCLVLGRPKFASGERNNSTFDDYQSNYWVIDIDGAPHDGDNASSILSCLPFLNGYSFVYYLSQSAGIKPGLRARVICRVEKKSLAELKEMARYANTLTGSRYIDATIYGPSRLIFSARPKITNAADPYLQRVFMVQGSSEAITIDLPKMVSIAKSGNAIKFAERPNLSGVWNGGEGNNRSYNAVVGMYHLRAYMAENWKNIEQAEKHWLEMLNEAGADADAIQNYGTSFFKRRYHDIRALKNVTTTLAVENVGREVSLETGRSQLSDVLAFFFNGWRGKAVGIKATPGSGKSTGVLNHIAKLYREGEEVGLGCPLIDYYVPTHALALELRKKAEELGIPTLIDYGRAQIVDGIPICSKPKAANAIAKIGHRPSTYICKNGEKECAHYTECAWRSMQAETNSVVLLIRTHAHLTTPYLPKEANGRIPSIAVIDEGSSFFKAALCNDVVDLSDLLKSRGHKIDALLSSLRDIVFENRLTITALKAAGFTEEIFQSFAALEKGRISNIKVDPHMSETRALKTIANLDTRALKRKQAWELLAACMHYNSMNRVHVDLDNNCLLLNWKLPLSALPTEGNGLGAGVLILGGTMEREVVNALIPTTHWFLIEIEKHKDTKIIMHNLRGSKTEWNENCPEQADIEEDETTSDNLIIEKILQHCNKDTLLITYKDILDKISHSPAIHLGATEGLDKFQGMNLVLYGRLMPRPADIENMTRALHCDEAEVMTLTSWYPKQPAQIRGQQDFAYAERHPDPRVERIRYITCEGEVMQAIARTRYIMNPCTIHILNRMALPLKVDELHTPTHPRQTAEEALYLPSSHRERSRLFGFTNGRTAQRDIDGEEWGLRHFALYYEGRRNGARGRADHIYVADYDKFKQAYENIQYVDCPYNTLVSKINALNEALGRHGPALLEEYNDSDIAVHDEHLGDRSGMRLDNHEIQLTLRISRQNAWVELADLY